MKSNAERNVMGRELVEAGILIPTSGFMYQPIPCGHDNARAKALGRQDLAGPSRNIEKFDVLPSATTLCCMVAVWLQAANVTRMYSDRTVCPDGTEQSRLGIPGHSQRPQGTHGGVRSGTAKDKYRYPRVPACPSLISKS